jgi:hypothetical protein
MINNIIILFIMEHINDDFKVNHVITLYDYDKKTIIFELDIEFDGNINNVDFSNDLLNIGSEIEKLPLNKSFYKVIKFNDNSYYLDFNY